MTVEQEHEKQTHTDETHKQLMIRGCWLETQTLFSSGFNTSTHSWGSSDNFQILLPLDHGLTSHGHQVVVIKTFLNVY